MSQTNAVEMVDVVVWVMVTEEGEYEIAKDASDLQAEAGVATRFVRVAVKVPYPQAIELEATIAAEPEAGELKVA